MAEFVALQTSGMDGGALKLRTLNNKSYLTGPVVMAKETVMNGLLYKGNELKRGVPGWNGRPVTVTHPKKDGNFVSANSPEVLEETQIGFIFSTNYDDNTTKLTADVWLDVAKLDKFTEVRDTVANGGMLEVSTGLFVDIKEGDGVLNNKEYKGEAVNHLPDHLALLPAEVGAFSISDGAGFPRVNVLLGTNEITFNERYRLVHKALKTKLGDKFYYIEEIFDNSVVVVLSNSLYAYEYNLDKDTGVLTLGEGVEVYQKVEYPPVNTLGTNMEVNDNDKKQVDEPVVEEVVTNEEDTKVEEQATTEESQVEPTANTEEQTVEETPVEDEPVANEDEELTEARALLAESKTEAISVIMANNNNSFSKEDLESMKYSQLKKIAALAVSAQAKADMSGLGGPGGLNSASNIGETPYVG